MKQRLSSIELLPHNPLKCPRLTAETEWKEIIKLSFEKIIMVIKSFHNTPIMTLWKTRPIAWLNNLNGEWETESCLLHIVPLSCNDYQQWKSLLIFSFSVTLKNCGWMRVSVWEHKIRQYANPARRFCQEERVVCETGQPFQSRVNLARHSSRLGCTDVLLLWTADRFGRFLTTGKHPFALASSSCPK